MISKKSTIILLILILMPLLGCSNSDKELKTDLDKDSYALGFQISSDFSRQELEIDIDKFIQGFKDAKTEEGLMTQEEVIKTLQGLQQKQNSKLQASKQKKEEDNRKAASDFAAKQKEDTDVITTESGLQYKVLTQGDGKKPVAQDRVKVHYEGKLLDGKVFDSSYERNSPAEFQLNQVIRGWTEALQLMPVGSTYELYIPSDLAYGSNPPPGSNIEPGSTLIFKVELLEILSP